MASPLPPDPYKILSVPKDAPLASIRSAYRKLVLTCHPDKFPDESVKAKKADEFHQVQQAYEILSDETRRQRYDERVKLAELRAELMSDKRNGLPRMATEFGPRTVVPPVYEQRSHAIYEERAPRRSYEDDYGRFKTERKFDDQWDYASSRRSSARLQEEERRRARQREHYEDDERRRASKEYNSKLYSSQKKTRDKDRKRDHATKYAQVEIESDSDSDSYYDRRESDSKRKHEESKRRDQEQTSRRSGKYHDSDSTDDLENKTLHRAINHVHKTEGRVKSETERRPSVARGYTSASARSPPPPPPPPAPSDSARRSSGRTRGTRESSRTRSSGKDRRPLEIVEPTSRASYEAGFRRPSMPTTTSEPHSIKVPYNSSKSGVPHRAATMEVRTEPRLPSIQRASTFNGTSRTADSVPTRSSKLRTHAEIPDSGYSSPGNSDSHIGRSPQYTSKKFQYVSDDDESDVRTPRVVPIQPDYFDTDHTGHDRQEREISPRARRGTERPGISRSSNARVTPIRSATYAPEPAPSRQPLQRSDSVRIPPPPPPLSSASQHRAPLYREVSYSPKDVSYSPKLDNIRYASRHPVSPRDKESDAYAYSESRDRPSLGGRETSFAQRGVASKVY